MWSFRQCPNLLACCWPAWVSWACPSPQIADSPLRSPWPNPNDDAGRVTPGTRPRPRPFGITAAVVPRRAVPPDPEDRECQQPVCEGCLFFDRSDAGWTKLADVEFHCGSQTPKEIRL